MKQSHESRRCVSPGALRWACGAWAPVVACAVSCAPTAPAPGETSNAVSRAMAAPAPGETSNAASHATAARAPGELSNAVSRATVAPVPDDMSIVEGLKMTLDRYENGDKKTVLTARKALVPVVGKSGAIHGFGVVVIMYAQTGEVEGRIETAECIFDRQRGTAHAPSLVRVRRDGLIIMGTGMDWDSNQEMVKLLKDVRVEFQRKKLQEWRKSQ